MKPINGQWKTESLVRPKNLAEERKKEYKNRYTVYEKLMDKHALYDSNQSILCHNSVSGTWGK